MFEWTAFGLIGFAFISVGIVIAARASRRSVSEAAIMWAVAGALILVAALAALLIEPR